MRGMLTAVHILMLRLMVATGNELSGPDQKQPDMTLAGAPKTVLSALKKLWISFLERLPMLVGGLIVLILTWIVWKVLQRVAEMFFERAELRFSLRRLLNRMLRLVVWLGGITVTAMIVFPDFTLGKVLTGLGLLSVGIAFAFRDIFENYFAGILILWRFPFEKGDFITCKDVMGRVEDISVHNTMLRRVTGELVVVPNAMLFKNPMDVLTNWQRRQMRIVVGVDYDESIGQAREAIQQALEGCESVMESPEVEVYGQTLADSSVEFEVAWWTEPEPGRFRRSLNEVIEAVKKALDDADIEIPFPQQTLSFREPVRMEMPEAEEESSGQEQ